MIQSFQKRACYSILTLIRRRVFWFGKKSALSIQFSEFSRWRNVHFFKVKYRSERTFTISWCLLMPSVSFANNFAKFAKSRTMWKWPFRYYKSKRVVCKMLPYKRKVTQNRQLNLEFKTVKNLWKVECLRDFAEKMLIGFLKKLQHWPDVVRASDPLVKLILMRFSVLGATFHNHF